MCVIAKIIVFQTLLFLQANKLLYVLDSSLSATSNNRNVTYDNEQCTRDDWEVRRLSVSRPYYLSHYSET